MVKINVQPDCGNSPKARFLKELTIGIASGDTDLITTIIPETITWDMVGGEKITGKESYLQALARHRIWKAKELTIHTIVTHGPVAAVNGEFIAADKSKFAFCDIYRFKTAGRTVLKSVTSFLIKIQ